MTGTDQRVADLERQVAELTASVHEIAMLWTIEDVLMGRPAGRQPVAPARRPRHLHAVNGDAR